MPDQSLDGAVLGTAFARRLRDAGVSVAPDAVTTFVRALDRAGTARSTLYWTGRTTLVHRAEDVAPYDRAFAALVAEPPAPDEGRPDHTVLVERGRSSPEEVLRHRDFADCTPEELDEVHRMLARLPVRLPHRRRRRLRSHPRGRHPDLRRTARAAVRTGGEPLRRAWRDPSSDPRRIVVVCDISGSMDDHARTLLRFAHALAGGARRVEVFALGTRLSRLTRELATRDPDAALAAAADRAPDRAGGTRLGDGLRRLVDDWGSLARGSSVIIASDGWDRGDPALVDEQMGRLRRLAHRVLWVNPHKASEGYEPLARGMAAALPHVDEFLPGHSFASLEGLAGVLGRR